MAASRFLSFSTTMTAAALFAGVVGGMLVACGSTNVVTVSQASTCDSSKCATGNTCLPLDGITMCRKTCASNADSTQSCPFGYTCVAPGGDVQSFCVQNTDGVKASSLGQYGAPCSPADGYENNKACDAAQGFLCFGESPTDANAYCTRFDCTTDRDCSAGFGCATINSKPNVTTAKRSIGRTLTACVRRAYCAACAVDLDCPTQDGKAAHCVGNDKNAGFCSPECASTAECARDAKCTDFGFGYKSCFPRAGLCVGDGSLCSPCRSDADCGDDGACVRGQYTTEKSCAKKSKTTCSTGSKQGSDFDCPAVTNGAKAQIRCLGSELSQVPQNYCHGLYALGEAGDVGCFTPDR